MIKLLAVLVLLGVVAGGGWYATTKQGEPSQKLPASEDTLGSYSYECTNDVTLRIEPATDMSTVRVMIRGAGFPSETIVTKVPTENARYENETLTFVGVGEEVQLTTGQSSAVCTPVFNDTEAPFHWGDADPVVFDPVRVASEGIIGRWALIEADVTMEFKEGGVLLEDRAGTVAEGSWKMSAPADAPVITMTFPDSPHGTSCAVATLTPDALRLACTGEGERYELSYVRAN
jgi:hypothetical protein